MFFTQLRWELFKLAARPRTWLGFGAAVLWQLLGAGVLRLPAVRAGIAHQFHRAGLNFAENFTGLTSSAYMLANAMTFVGSLFIALIAADLVAQEREEGTLRMIFSRPITRGRIFVLKLLVALGYTLGFTWFVGLCGLAIGLIAEGPGRLAMVGYKESVFGVFEWSEGLWRYWLAVLLVSISECTVALLAFAFSCLRMKPAAATVLALTVFIADDLVRNVPALHSVRHHFLMTRVIAWVGAYNDPLHVARLRRSYSELAIFDVALAGAAWLAFRRNEFKP
ncbi:MAG: type transport system permease protein [Chthoniobacter sp.]|jgi:ABC-2 type transport system permease protein|nr:type transport system permease protein [Chthoniobacter sp.]